MPRVSICIPTYNRKDYIVETLKSVFAQTYKDYEVIIVDDGSIDGTEEMIKKAAYPNLRYCWQENAGEAAARNKLVSMAQGEFITFIDSDDLLMPDAVERMAKVMIDEGGDVVVYGPYLRIDSDGNVIGRCRRKLYSGFITSQLFNDIIVHPNGSMFPKRILQQAGGFDESLKVCTDYDLELRLSLKYRFIALDEPTFKHRRHCGNVSKDSLENRITEFNVLKKFYYDSGGDKVIPPAVAMKRLAKEAYRTSKLALRDKMYDLALFYLEESIKMKLDLKPLFLLIWIKTAKHACCHTG